MNLRFDFLVEKPKQRGRAAACAPPARLVRFQNATRKAGLKRMFV